MHIERNELLNFFLLIKPIIIKLIVHKKIVFADPILIQRFIHSVYGNVDKAKKLIEVSFAMRNNYANIFLKRDPSSIESKRVFEVT